MAIDHPYLGPHGVLPIGDPLDLDHPIVSLDRFRWIVLIAQFFTCGIELRSNMLLVFAHPTLHLWTGRNRRGTFIRVIR